CSEPPIKKKCSLCVRRRCPSSLSNPRPTKPTTCRFSFLRFFATNLLPTSACAEQGKIGCSTIRFRRAAGQLQTRYHSCLTCVHSYRFVRCVFDQSGPAIS